MSTFSELASLGTVVSAFNQTSFRGNTTQVAGKSITNGYCAGVCLDWMRRALLSGANRNQGSLGYASTQAKGRSGDTVERMGIAYKEQAPTYVKETNLQQAVKFLAVLKNGAEETYKINGVSRTGVPIPTNQAKVLLELWELAADLNPTKSPAGVLSKARLSSLHAAALTRVDPQRTARVASGRDWSNLAGQLDDEFKTLRLAAGRQVTKKSFSSVQVLRSSTQKQYGSAGAWSGELEANGFERDCCTILSFSHSGGGGGHAVAVHVTGQHYHFFDPNFGTFKYTLENLMNALQHLFWAPYFSAEPGSTVLDANKAVYLRRDTVGQAMPAPMNDVGYTIFERA